VVAVVLCVYRSHSRGAKPSFGAKKTKFFFHELRNTSFGAKNKSFSSQKKKKKKSDRDRFEKTLPVIIKKEFLNFYWRFLFFYFFHFFRGFYIDVGGEIFCARCLCDAICRNDADVLTIEAAV
jgi:hypothetical protein